MNFFTYRYHDLGDIQNLNELEKYILSISKGKVKKEIKDYDRRIKDILNENRSRKYEISAFALYAFHNPLFSSKTPRFIITTGISGSDAECIVVSSHESVKTEGEIVLRSSALGYSLVCECWNRITMPKEAFAYSKRIWKLDQKSKDKVIKGMLLEDISSSAEKRENEYLSAERENTLLISPYLHLPERFFGGNMKKETMLEWLILASAKQQTAFASVSGDGADDEVSKKVEDLSSLFEINYGISGTILLKHEDRAVSMKIVSPDSNLSMIKCCSKKVSKKWTKIDKISGDILMILCCDKDGNEKEKIVVSIRKK